MEKDGHRSGPEPGATGTELGSRRDLSPQAVDASESSDAVAAQNHAGSAVQDYRAAEQEIDLWDYINVVLRRRWTVAATFVICVASALILSFAVTPIYTAKALLKIKPGGMNVTDIESVEQTLGNAQAYADFYQTQYDILASRTLARRTIEKAGLEDHPFISGEMSREAPLGRLKAWLASIAPTGDEKDPAEQALVDEQRAVNRFQDSVTINPRRRSFLVELDFSSPDPELSRSVAAAMAHEYLDLTLDQGIDAATQARNFIEKQLAKVKAALERSEEELHTFARGNDILALEQEERVIDARLGDLNAQFTEAQAERIWVEALYQQTRGGSTRVISAVVKDSLVRSLRAELSTVTAEYAELGAQFTPEYPEMRRMRAHITKLQSTIAAEEARVVESISSDFQRAVEREDQLGRQLDRQRTVVAQYAEKAIAFKIHRREVDTNRTLYDGLLRRMKEVEVTQALSDSTISIVDMPETPIDPSSPSVPLNVAVAMLLGLLGGVGIAFAQEQLDDSLKTPDDVERYLRLATLGTIPEFTMVSDSAVDTPELEVTHQPTSAGAEAIRTLRASLFLAAPGGLPTRLLLTSVQPSEGKTCISINLAAALAQMGRKVCIVDCDLRRPRVNKALAKSLSPGVTNYLTGNVSLDDVIRPTVQPGLDVVTAGPIPPNPVDLLDSANMTTFLNELEQRYDHILVDGPPALGFADVPIITSQVGGACLLVARAGLTSWRNAQQTCEYLIRMQSKLLGVVLNRVSTRKAGYSYYGYYGYYGDHYAKREEDEALENVENVA